jgi:flagellar biosynthesis/type III secretory pathway chaperone
LQSVYELLTELKTAQEDLYSLASRKRDAVLKNNTDDLAGIVQLEYAQLSRMNHLEKKRLALLREGWGEKGPGMTVAMLAEEAGDPMAARLRQVRQELLALMTRLKELNRENRTFVETQLEYTEMMLNLLGSPADPLNNFYGTDGRSSDSDFKAGSSVFDAEV